MTGSRRKINLAIEVIAIVLTVGAIDLTSFRPDLSVGASLRLFAGEVVAGAIVWVAASLLLDGRIRWGLEAQPNEPRRVLRTVVGGCVFFVLLTAAILAFGWRSMSLVPLVMTAFLVWWLLAGLIEHGPQTTGRADGQDDRDDAIPG